MDFDFQPRRSFKRGPTKIDTSAQLPAKPPSFKTPEEVAAKEVPETISSPATPIKSTANWRQKLNLQWPPGRKEYIVLAIFVIFILIGGGATYALTHHSPAPTPAAMTVVKPKAPSKPVLVPSTLSGLPVDPSLNKLPVTGVMIENSTDARPQSGLSQAMVVFEAIAEGGVTRFMALFQDTSPTNVGPIRSARPYYVQWALGFDTSYAHVGGSPDALADIKSWGVHDLDEFANAGSYHRVSTRAAPHNVYTAISTLNQLESKKGYTSSFTGFLRKKEAPVVTPTAKSIDLTLSGPIYNAHYDYVAASNSYNRSEGGAVHIDANTNAQISPKVIIAMVVPETRGALDASGAYYSNYNVIGSGTAYVFQDGTATAGTWTKSSNNSQLTFTDSAGKPLPLNPGQTWITALTTFSDIHYSP